MAFRRQMADERAGAQGRCAGSAGRPAARVKRSAARGGPLSPGTMRQFSTATECTPRVGWESLGHAPEGAKPISVQRWSPAAPFTRPPHLPGALGPGSHSCTPSAHFGARRVGWGVVGGFVSDKADFCRRLCFVFMVLRTVHRRPRPLDLAS